MAKVYLSARFGRRAEMLALSRSVARCGHEVVSSWVRARAGDDVNSRDAPWLAYEDLREVASCDVLIHFAEAYDVPGAGRGGRFCEYGAAAALGKRLVIVGHEPENHFHRLRATWVPSKAALLRLLAEWGGK